MVAIGAQVQGGALGTDSNTMAGFNKNITDRIIPIKKDTNTQEKENEAKTRETEYGYLLESLSTIYEFFADTTQEWIFWSKASYDANSSAQYAGALRDVISKITSFSKNPNKYNAIIPTKLSLEMDGIGGLVIGHIFRIPDDVLPKGYKGGAFGSKLGYIITGIGHKISNNDWTTNIDAQTIILDDPTEGIDVDYKSLVQAVAESFVKGSTAVPADFVSNSTKPLGKTRQAVYNEAERLEPGFQAKVAQVAKNIGVSEQDLAKSEQDLAKIMFLESGGTYDPSKINPLKCVGLTQFCGDADENGNL
jgi:hypothetical protein